MIHEKQAAALEEIPRRIIAISAFGYWHAVEMPIAQILDRRPALLICGLGE
jgi:hypothetical protein